MDNANRSNKNNLRANKVQIKTRSLVQRNFLKQIDSLPILYITAINICKCYALQVMKYIILIWK